MDRLNGEDDLKDQLDDDTGLDTSGDDTDNGDTGEVDEPVLEGKDKDDTAPKKPASIRESLKEAFKEQAKLENDDKNSPEDKKSVTKAKDKSVEESNTQKPDTATQKPTESALKPPVGWTKEAKAKWNTLPPEIQQSVAKREKEVSDGFAQYGEATRRLKELDSVLEPRRAAIQSHGVSEAQIVNNLFQWMEGLTGPNKAEVFKQLGKNFSIDISTLVPNTPQQTQENNQQGEIPAPLQQYMQTIDQKLSTWEQQQRDLLQRDQQQRESNAAEVVTQWAKDKPHFEAVRPLMHSLLGSGQIPLKNNALDLDAAYEAAVYATPHVREQYLAEKAEKEAAVAKAEADKKRIANINKINAAKKAGVSLKAAAPGAPLSNVKKLNGNKPQSVKDSIRAAMEEIANQ